MRHMLPRDIWPIKLSSTCFAGDSGFCGHMCRVILAGPQPMSFRNLQSNRQWKVYGSEEVDARLDKFQGSQDPFQRIHDAVPAMKFSFLYAICRIPFYIDNTIQQKPLYRGTAAYVKLSGLQQADSSSAVVFCVESLAE